MSENSSGSNRNEMHERSAMTTANPIPIVAWANKHLTLSQIENEITSSLTEKQLVHK